MSLGFAPFLALCLLLTLCRQSEAKLEGSGDGGGESEGDLDLEEEDDGASLDRVIVPSRVVPSLQTPPAPGPQVGGAGVTVGRQTMSPRPEVSRLPQEDPIYLEEGSGDGIERSRTSTPSFASSSATPHMPTTPRSRESTIVTDRISNSPPMLQKKLMKIPVTAGKTRRYKVPEDTFFDHEDGNTRNLKLSLRYPNGSLVREDNWIRFDNQSQEIWILPVNENDIGRWKFQLNAQDRQGQAVEDVLEVVVRQFSGTRLVNHKFELAFSFTSWQPSVLKNWEWKILDKIRLLFGNTNVDQILVKSIHTRPFLIGWTNSTLIQQNCPKDEIQDLYRKMVDFTSSPSEELKSMLGEHIFVKSVVLKFYGSCLEDTTSSNSFGQSIDNNAPVIRNPIDRINVTAGEILRFRVPEDTCYDKEDGSTSRLSLHLLTMNRKELSPRYWLRFDARNQEFHGVPLEEEVGREEYQLVCSDRSGLSAIDGIEISVLNRPFSERFGVEFSFVFQHDIAEKRVELVNMISSFFGDDSPKNVIVKSISDSKLVWYNKSLTANSVGCNDEKVDWMRRQMSPSESGVPISAALIQHFRSFPLTNASVVLRGSCSFTTSFPEVTQDTHQTIFHGIIPSSEYLMTFLIPAVIISCMLFLAILLACILHRKRKAGKLNLFYSEALPPRVPVILQDELYDDNDQVSYRRQITARDRPEEIDRLIQGTRIVLQGDPVARPTPTYRKA